MNKMEKVVDRIGVIIGITMITMVIMAMSSCGVNRGLTNEQVERRNNIDYQLDKLYLEYNYQRDSLIMEFYKK